jgi:acyl-CoA reductase-like NAD-dependent aldehyde dehydrogenase
MMLNPGVESEMDDRSHAGPLIGNYINGAHSIVDTDTDSPVTNPATGAVSAYARLSNAAGVDAAVSASASATAAQSWSQVPPRVRGRTMFRTPELRRSDA